MQNKINQITILISQIQNAHNSEITTAQAWMMEHVTDHQLKQLISKVSVVGYHVLDILSVNSELTGARIAKKLGVTRGGVTRAARKMVGEGLIEAVQHEDNKKNIYYQITKSGQKLVEWHTKMYDELYQQLEKKIEDEFTLEELDTIIRFLTEIKGHIM